MNANSAEFISIEQSIEEIDISTKKAEKILELYSGNRLSDMSYKCPLAFYFSRHSKLKPKSFTDARRIVMSLLYKKIEKGVMPDVERLSEALESAKVGINIAHVMDVIELVTDRIKKDSVVSFNEPINIKDSKDNYLIGTTSDVVIRSKGLTEVFVLINSYKTEATMRMYLNALHHLHVSKNVKVIVTPVVILRDIALVPTAWVFDPNSMRFFPADVERIAKKIIVDLHKDLPVKTDKTSFAKKVGTTGALCKKCFYKMECTLN